MKRFSFTIKGKVQGVYFRKYTQRKASSLGLVGTVQNLSNGDVSGVVEGEESKVNDMKEWLSKTGSPSSR